MRTDVTGWLRTLWGDPPDGYRGGPRYFFAGAYNTVFFSLTSRYPLGTNVFDREWDLLVILDACRVDALRQVAPEFDFIGDVGAIWSVGSASHEWLCKTFTETYADEIAETAYVSANPNTFTTFTGGEHPPQKYVVPFMWADWNVVDESAFGSIRQIQHHDHEEQFDTVPAELVTDHAIDVGRTADADRLIVHYFQPHRPHIAAAYREGRAVTSVENRPWTAIERGEASREEVWELYLDNLRFALDAVERLLENVDAETVAITADHGELFGEFGQYGHPEGIPHPNLKKVPWAVTTATDERTSEPTVDLERQRADSRIQEQLEKLGYV